MKVSIRILKLCDKSIVKPLFIIFKNCKLKKTFLNLWKKANVVPIHKKGEKHLIKNYRPVSLLPIPGNIYERLIFNSLFNYTDENELLNPNQSDFRPFDSCVGLLLSINHEIFSGFGCGLPGDVRAVFLGMPGVFGGILFPAVGRGVSGAGSGFRVGWPTTGRVLLFFLCLFASIGGGGGRWAIILWGSGTFLIFPSFLRSS